MKSDLPAQVKFGCRLEGVPIVFSERASVQSLGLVDVTPVPPLWPALAGFVYCNGMAMPVFDPSGNASLSAAPSPVLRVAFDGQVVGFLFDGQLMQIRLLCLENALAPPPCPFQKALSNPSRADTGETWWTFDPVLASRSLGVGR